MNFYFGKKIILFVLVICLLFLLVLLFSFKKKNKILETSLKQSEELIKQKQEEIVMLQEQLQALQKRQMVLEKNLVTLKVAKEKRKQEIEQIKSIEEVCNEFKKLGYQPVCQ